MRAPGWILLELRNSQEWCVLDAPAGSWTHGQMDGTPWHRWDHKMSKSEHPAPHLAQGCQQRWGDPALGHDSSPNPPHQCQEDPAPSSAPPARARHPGWGDRIQTRLIPVVFQVAEPPAKEDAEICRTLLLLPEGTRSLPPGPSIWRPWRRRAVGALHAWCHPPVPTVRDTAPSRPLPADGLSRGQRDGAASNEYFMPSPTGH